MPDDRDLILRELCDILNINDLSEMTIKDFNDTPKYKKFLLLLKYESLESDIIQKKREHVRYYYQFENELEFIEDNDILVFFKMTT